VIAVINVLCTSADPSSALGTLPIAISTTAQNLFFFFSFLIDNWGWNRR